jgi:hypothetical protein
MEEIKKCEEKKKELNDKAKEDAKNAKLKEMRNNICSRKGLLLSFSAQKSPKIIKTLRISFYILLIAILTLSSTDYFICISRFERINDILHLIFKASKRSDSLLQSTITTQNILLLNRYVFFIKYLFICFILRENIPKLDEETFGMSKDEAIEENKRIMQISFEALSSAQTEISTNLIKVSDQHQEHSNSVNTTLVYKGSNSYFQEHDFSLKEAIEEVIIQFSLFNSNVSSFLQQYSASSIWKMS